MPVRIELFKFAMQQVKLRYQEECELAKNYNCAPKEFNLLIRPVVDSMRLSAEDSADLITELAKFFGRRGGKKQPRKKRAKKMKPPKQPRLKKSLKKWVTLRPVVISRPLQLDMLNMRRQAHEDICPID